MTVTASLAAGILTINASDGNNRVLVRRNPAGELHVTSQSNQEARKGVGNYPGVKSMKVDLGPGANFFDAHGLGVPYTLDEGTYDADKAADVKYDDFNQQGSEDCGWESGCSGYVLAGGKFSVEYAGPITTTPAGASYHVRVGSIDQIVVFNGTKGTLDYVNRRPGVFGADLVHRAAVQQVGARAFHASVVISLLRGGYPMSQLDVATHSPSVLPAEFGSDRAKILSLIRNGLSTGKIVIAETAFPAGFGPFPGCEIPPYRVALPDGAWGSGTVLDHQYTVMGVDDSTVTARNPWGTDKNGKGNGIQKFPFEGFVRSCQTFKAG